MLLRLNLNNFINDMILSYTRRKLFRTNWPSDKQTKPLHIFVTRTEFTLKMLKKFPNCFLFEWKTKWKKLASFLCFKYCL